MGQKAKNTQQLLKLMQKLCSKRRELLRKKMPVPLFIFSNNLDMWSKRLSKTDREFWIQMRSKDCQHSNSNFSKSTRFYEGETTPRTWRDSYFQTIH